jgi:hypothetical protein
MKQLAVGVSTYFNPGGSFTCGITMNDTVKCWGCNVRRIKIFINFKFFGVLGLASSSYKTNCNGDYDYCTCYGDVLALPVVNLGTSRFAVQVCLLFVHCSQKLSAGADYMCAVLNTGEVKCWGIPDFVLGQGKFSDYQGDPNGFGQKGCLTDKR